MGFPPRKSRALALTLAAAVELAMLVASSNAQQPTGAAAAADPPSVEAVGGKLLLTASDVRASCSIESMRTFALAGWPSSR